MHYLALTSDYDGTLATHGKFLVHVVINLYVHLFAAMIRKVDNNTVKKSF